MKPLLILIALAFTASLSAQSLKLSAVANGVLIEGGTAGRLVIGAPTITGSDKKARKPVFTPAADGASATAVYPDGFTIKIGFSAKDGVISYAFSQVPSDALSIVLNTTIPSSYNESGSYSVDGGETKPFPSTAGKQLFDQGAFKQLNLIGNTGEGLSIKTPVSYQQLQDNRVWGTQSFSWIYHYDLLRYPNETVFNLTVALLKPVPAKK